MRSYAGAVVMLFGLVLGAPARVEAQAAAPPPAAPAQDDEPDPGVFRWRNRPSIQLGEFRLDLRLKLQYDFRRFDPEIDEETTDFRVSRWGLNGEVGSHVEFQIERDFEEDGRWRDVYVNWRSFRQASVMAGRFKVPFGREENIGITDVDFAYRTLVSTTIPPARDKGVMVHGRFLRRALTYEVGVFEGDGDNGRLQEPQFAIIGDPEGLGHSYAARITALPLRVFSDAFDTFRIGAAYGGVDVPEGLNSLRGTSVYGTYDFFKPVYVKGTRQRFGAELYYTPGPVGIGGEWMQAREQRLGQGLGEDDLSDLVTTGWYGSVTWLITGEDKEDFNNPRDPLFQGGIGAVEVGARYEVLQLESADTTGVGLRNNPRAEHLLRNQDAVWTVGVNWFPNRWVRVVANAIHETFEDPLRTPQLGTTEFWSGVLRLQLVF